MYLQSLDCQGKRRYQEKLEIVGLSLDDDYFESGHVRTVLCMAYGTGKTKNVLLKAKVNPSQRLPDNAHEAWLVAKLEGDIFCVHCTCMAG